MLDLFAYVGYFVSIVFFAITPLPVLPFILAAYLRFSYLAIPLVVAASLISAVLQYMMGRFFPHLLRPFSFLKNNRFMNRLENLLKDLKLESLVFIRIVGFLPSKIVNFGCGIFQVPFSIFFLSLMPMLVVDQFIFLAGASISKYADSFLPGIRLSSYGWLPLLLLYILFTLSFSIVSSFFLKHFALVFRRRFQTFWSDEVLGYFYDKLK